MLLPAFQLQLSERIQSGQATIGKYDGRHPVLTCATLAGKIFMHNPHKQGVDDATITFLNINKTITSVVASQMLPGVLRDVLMVGTPSNIQCYDVEHNKDLFFKDVGDGVNAMVAGQFANIAAPVVIVGGNCSIQGFDSKGKETFWTVTGDNVGAMAFCDVDGDGRHELLVGSDDFDIRIFQGEDVVAEVSEADQIIALVPVHLQRFGYGLVNGTIGVYDQLERCWRVKSKHSVCALEAFDLDGDGVPELVSGWSNGRVEVRHADTGDVVYRDTLATGAVSAIVSADYRGTGAPQLVVCGIEGELRGYLPADPDEPEPEPDFTAQQAAVAELTQRKQELLYELTSYHNMRNPELPQPEANLIPNSTRVDSFVVVNEATASCDLVLKTNNDAVIRGVVVFGEQIFEEESLFLYPKNPDTQLAVPLRPIKDVSVVLMAKVLVGRKTSTCFHIFELEVEVPKFALYAPVDKAAHRASESSVSFAVPERIPRLANWVENRFSVITGLTGAASKGESLEVAFLCLRDKRPVHLTMVPKNNEVQVEIRTDSMDIAGEMVLDLATYIGVQDLASVADFPAAMTELRGVLEKVEEYNATRLRMNADMADSSNLVKQLLIKAEDARILGDMKSMRRYYRSLHDLNLDLVAEHDKRATNHVELLKNLKEVNLMIQSAAKLRTGAPKTRVVTACRTCIKNSNFTALMKIIRDGDGPV
ncbi:hypothetical protein FOA52_002284 [Chlamydomonas sp. UWO 241]|nr:hypothetical protein FOA52_002284 [Chlamydomonas sp. UWO 241]